VSPRGVSHRAGLAMIEVVVAAGVLLVVMSFVSSLVFRIDFVWKDTGHHRAAMNELSNQLERLTLLSPDKISAAIEGLEPSEMVSRTLDKPELSGELVKDDWGDRIVLKLNWRRPYPGKPVQLVAWLPSDPETTLSSVSSSGPQGLAAATDLAPVRPAANAVGPDQRKTRDFEQSFAGTDP
jgi:hypothetical protein